LYDLVKKIFPGLALMKRAGKLSFDKENKNAEVFQDMMNSLVSFLLGENNSKLLLDLEVALYLVLMGTYNFDKAVFLEMEFTNNSIKEMIDKIEIYKAEPSILVGTGAKIGSMDSIVVGAPGGTGGDGGGRGFERMLEDAEILRKKRGLSEIPTGRTKGVGIGYLYDLALCEQFSSGNLVNVVKKGTWFKEKWDYRFGTPNFETYWEVLNAKHKVNSSGNKETLMTGFVNNFQRVYQKIQYKLPGQESFQDGGFICDGNL
jgi:hypothetical protein